MGSPSTVFLFPSGSDREIDLDLAESSARVLKCLIEVRYPFHRATGKWVLVLAVVQALWGVEVQQYFGHASKMFHRRSKNRWSSLAPLYANPPPSKGKSYPLSYHSNHSVTISYSYYPPKKTQSHYSHYSHVRPLLALLALFPSYTRSTRFSPTKGDPENKKETLPRGNSSPHMSTMPLILSNPPLTRRERQSCTSPPSPPNSLQGPSQPIPSLPIIVI